MSPESSRFRLLGVPIDAVTQQSAVERIHALLSQPQQSHVATPNNEMLVEATRNPALHRVLHSTALNLPDSTGVVLASRLRGFPLPARVTGVDTVERLCSDLPREHGVFLLGAAEGVAQKAADFLVLQNPRLHIAGTYAGSPQRSDAADIIARIRKSGAHLLLVAFGSPAQELWIAEHLSQMPNIRVAIGVGGTFDFLAGTVQRAPAVLRRCGMEWLWRLMLQPKRIGRICTAVMIFPLKLALYREG